MALLQLISYDRVLKSLGTRSYLLLGNGFSVACNPIFRYSSLYEAAVAAGLSDRAQAVFKRLGTTNFEGVMKLLEDSHWVARNYGLTQSTSESEMLADVEVIKRTLIAAVASNHLAHSGCVSDLQKQYASAFLAPFQAVFTTNYDLLAYWVSMSGSKVLFQDGFREDDADREAPYVVFSERLGRNRGLLYLHGALHLHLAHGELRKHCWSRTHRPLTQLVREGLDAGNYPLFVAEGSAEQKLEQIQRVGYLWYCLDKLARIQSPLVVYGHSLGPSDQHIVDILIKNTDLATIYIGVHGGNGSEASRSLRSVAERMIASRRTLIERRERGKPLSVAFFASESAPVWGPAAI